MLTLTDAECRLITEKTTVSQIRELKNFNRQEPEEVETAEGQAPTRSPLQRCIIEYFREKREMLDAAMKCIAEEEYKEASEIVNPGGAMTFKKGILFLFLYDYKEGVKYKTFGREDIVLMSWEDFGREIFEVFLPAYSAEESTYDRFYGTGEEEEKKEPEKEEEKTEETAEIRNEEGSVATSQQEEKEGEDDVDEMEEEDEAESGDEEENPEAGEPADEAEPGDDADGEDGEVEAGEPEEEDAGETGGPDMEMSDLEKKFELNGLMAGIRSAMRIMQELYEKQDWQGVIIKAENIIHRAKKIQELQKEEEEECR